MPRKTPKAKRRTLELSGYRPPKGVKSWYRESSGWHVIFTDETRRPKNRWVSLETHADPIAAGRFIERAQAYDLGQYDPWGHTTRSVTFGEAMDAFLAADPRLRESTRSERRQTLTHLAETLPGGKTLALSAVTTADLRAFLYRDATDKHGVKTGRTLAASTRAGYYSRLRTFFRWCVKTKLLRDDPSADDLERPPVERTVPAHLTPGDVDRIVEAYRVHAEENRGRWEDGALAWFEPVVLFAVNTGLRLGEIVALRWADVVLPASGHGRIYVRNYRRADGTERKTKTGGERTVPVTAECRDVLETLYGARTAAERADDTLTVFRGPRGGALDPGHLSRTFRRYRRLAKLPEGIHFHSLRHTAASWLVSRGVSLRLVQDVLGHSSIRSTEIYSHLLPGATDTIVAALDGVRDVPARPAARTPRPAVPVAASADCNPPATEKRTQANSYELSGALDG